MAITFHPPDGKNDGRWGSRSTFLTCTPITFLRVGHYKTVKLNELPISKVATGMARNGPQALVFCRRPNSNLRSPRRKNLGCVTGAVTWSERGSVCICVQAEMPGWTLDRTETGPLLLLPLIRWVPRGCMLSLCRANLHSAWQAPSVQSPVL